ncbi:phage holin, LLH family [Insulibacter thermoxylanivorax]|nr:phage holin, LLH family [Insulibacter thermoxylanivorax]
MSPWFEIALLLLIVMIIIWLAAGLSMYRRIAELLDARTHNEKRIYVHETGEEAVAYAESMEPNSGREKHLERAVDYMRRQFQERQLPFDYEQARAVIEKAALRRGIDAADIGRQPSSS